MNFDRQINRYLITLKVLIPIYHVQLLIVGTKRIKMFFLQQDESNMRTI